MNAKGTAILARDIVNVIKFNNHWHSTLTEDEEFLRATPKVSCERF